MEAIENAPSTEATPYERIQACEKQAAWRCPRGGYTPDAERISDECKVTLRGVEKLTGLKTNTCPLAIPVEVAKIASVYRLLEMGVTLTEQGILPTRRLLQGLEAIKQGVNAYQKFEYERIEKEREEYKKKLTNGER